MRSSAKADEFVCSRGDSSAARLPRWPNRVLCGASQREAVPRVPLSASRSLYLLHSDSPRPASLALRGRGIGRLALNGRFVRLTAQNDVAEKPQHEAGTPLQGVRLIQPAKIRLCARLAFLSHPHSWPRAAKTPVGDGWSDRKSTRLNS